jgi:hypothetical protein
MLDAQLNETPVSIIINGVLRDFALGANIAVMPFNSVYEAHASLEDDFRKNRME